MDDGGKDQERHQRGFRIRQKRPRRMKHGTRQSQQQNQGQRQARENENEPPRYFSDHAARSR